MPTTSTGICQVYKIKTCVFRVKSLKNHCPLCKIRGKNPTNGICRHVNL